MARYMIIVKSSYEEEINPPAFDFDQMIVEMGKYNELLIEKGVMLAGEGLTQSKDGARVRFSKDKPPTVKDGPFTEAKELVGGFWIIKAENLEEAVGWAKLIPFQSGEVEVRRVSETEDFEFNDTTRTTLERELELREKGTWDGKTPDRS